MPGINGYSIYTAYHKNSNGRYAWTVRVYREADDQHIHSAEQAYSLSTALAEAELAIKTDMLPDDVEQQLDRAGWRKGERDGRWRCDDFGGAFSTYRAFERMQFSLKESLTR